MLGIIALLAMNTYQQPIEKTIAELSANEKGGLVAISGVITSARKTNENYFFKVCQASSCVEVPIFQSLAEKIQQRGLYLSNIKASDYVEVIGQVGEYQGKLQVAPTQPTGFDLIKASS